MDYGLSFDSVGIISNFLLLPLAMRLAGTIVDKECMHSGKTAALQQSHPHDPTCPWNLRSNSKTVKRVKMQVHQSNFPPSPKHQALEALLFTYHLPLAKRLSPASMCH